MNRIIHRNLFEIGKFDNDVLLTMLLWHILQKKIGLQTPFLKGNIDKCKKCCIKLHNS